MRKLLPLLISLVACGFVGSEPLRAQTEVVPAGSSRAFTPPIDRRGYRGHGYRHRFRFYRRHRL